MAGLFGNLFDMNHDGKMDAFESATEYHFFMEMQKKDSASDSWDDEDDEEELEEQLEDAGIDMFDLELMDEEERREALEDAGLDPDDYDDMF